MSRVTRKVTGPPVDVLLPPNEARELYENITPYSVRKRAAATKRMFEEALQLEESTSSPINITATPTVTEIVCGCNVDVDVVVKLDAPFLDHTAKKTPADYIIAFDNNDAEVSDEASATAKDTVNLILDELNVGDRVSVIARKDNEVVELGGDVQTLVPASIHMIAEIKRAVCTTKVDQSADYAPLFQHCRDTFKKTQSSKLRPKALIIVTDGRGSCTAEYRHDDSFSVYVICYGSTAQSSTCLLDVATQTGGMYTHIGVGSLVTNMDAVQSITSSIGTQKVCDIKVWFKPSSSAVKCVKIATTLCVTKKPDQPDAADSRDHVTFNTAELLYDDGVVAIQNQSVDEQRVFAFKVTLNFDRDKSATVVYGTVDVSYSVYGAACNDPEIRRSVDVAVITRPISSLNKYNKAAVRDVAVNDCNILFVRGLALVVRKGVPMTQIGVVAEDISAIAKCIPDERIHRILNKIRAFCVYSDTSYQHAAAAAVLFTHSAQRGADFLSL